MDGGDRADALYGGATAVHFGEFYKYCEQEQLVDRNPALNVRRPKVDYESRTLGLDRNEFGRLSGTGRLGSPRDHALASLLALNGLRVSRPWAPTSATSTSSVGTERSRSCARAASTSLSLWPPARPGQSTSTPARERPGDLAQRQDGRMDRYAADRTVKRLAPRAGIAKRISPHGLRPSSITCALDAGVALETFRTPPAMLIPPSPRRSTRLSRPYFVN